MIGDPPVGHEVERFAEAMEAQLRAARGRGGWHNSPTEFLVRKLMEEVGTLMVATMDKRRPDNVEVEQWFRTSCVDVANVAMMLYDNSVEGRP